MKILMFGWEFPPFSHGGLGRACHGLTNSLAKLGAEVTFVVPVFPDENDSGAVKVLSALAAKRIRVKGVFSAMTPYTNPSEFYNNAKNIKFSKSGKMPLYGRNLFAEVDAFTEKACLVAEGEDFDIIHAHDWMTFGAAMKTKEASGKPLVLHVHSTEIDRTGGNGVNQHIYDIERSSMHGADKIITVSRFEKSKLIEHYGLPADKISVAHNAINAFEYSNLKHAIDMNRHYKVVLFLGRVTLQKGPDYFLYAAKKVAKHRKDVIFVVAGSGDMVYSMMERAAQLGIQDKVFFTGYISDQEIEKLMKSSNVLVMPSVAEPFGIVALEALINKVPLIVSKQSGVIEVVNHCLKVDFWDVNEMANKIVALLEYESLSSSIRENGFCDVQGMNWDFPARSCMSVYNNMLRGG